MAVVRRKRSPEDKVKLAESRITDAGDTFDYLRMLVYGMNGKGKTRFGASGPKPIVIDCNEKGTLSIRQFSDAKVFQVKTWTDIDLAFWYLNSGKHDRETVVIDNVTSLAQLCMKFVLGDEASRDPTKDPNMPRRQDWGKVGELMRTVILNFRNLDMHVIFLAQERKGFAEEDEENPEVYPEVSPSIRSTLTAAVDIIGRIYIKEVVKKEKGAAKARAVPEYRLFIGPSPIYITKDRSESGLPGTIRLTKGQDNLTRLIERIRKGATHA